MSNDDESLEIEKILLSDPSININATDIVFFILILFIEVQHHFTFHVSMEISTVSLFFFKPKISI